MIAGDTIAAIATAPGRGGVAVVRVSGPDAFQVSERIGGMRRGARESEEARGVGVFKIHSPVPPDASDPFVVDECVVLFFRSPRSYTGEDVVEFQCHGGSVTPRRVLEACLAAGARLAHRGEFTERAFLNGKLDYDQAESVLDLIDAKTPRAADAALEGLSGRKRREIRSLYADALDLSSTLEHALDVSEEELPARFFADVKDRLAAFRDRLSDAVRKFAEGLLLQRGARVVLAGPPNVGKSSLLNALLEENRAIVSDVPGTTRDSIEAWMDLDGWPVRLTDTAGLRETKDEIEEEGVRRAEDLIAQADVVLMLRSCEVEKGERDEKDERVVWVSSKCDLGRGEGLNVSVKTGEGLEELKRTIVAKLAARTTSLETGADSSERLAVLRETLSIIDRTCLQADSPDLVLLGNDVRRAAEKIGALIGATYSSDLLDNLFSRFCVGK